ncbi:MAG: HU family DNA-binding protein [Candidatus Amulumruptor sp.]
MDKLFLDKTGMTREQASKMLDTIRDCLVKCALQGDSVALPGFGTFVTVKDDERVDRDLSTGRKVLLPPHLSMDFKSSSALLKSLPKSI